MRANSKPRAAITEERKFGALLRAIDDYDGWPTIKAALKFLSLTFARPGEVRDACRSEILFEKSTWRIPGERPKTRRPHDIPLSRQALNVAQDMWPLSDDADLLFPSIRSASKRLSENAINAALRRMGHWPRRNDRARIPREREREHDLERARIQSGRHRGRACAPARKRNPPRL